MLKSLKWTRLGSLVTLLCLFLGTMLLPPALAYTKADNPNCVGCVRQRRNAPINRLSVRYADANSTLHSDARSLAARLIQTNNSIATSNPITEQLISGQSAQTIEQQASQLYQTERYAEAVDLWQQTASAYRASGDRPGEALALSNLSLTYQQLGQWQAAEKAIATSLSLLSSRLPTPDSRLLFAQTLDVKGRLQLAQGQAQSALDTWQQAAKNYAQMGEEIRLIRNRMNQAQALQSLGLYRQAQKILSEVNQALQKQPDSLLKATSLRSLGNVLRVVGDLERSQQVLQQSLAIAETNSNAQAIGETLLSLGNTAQIQKDDEAAFQFYQRAADTNPGSTITRIQAQLNQLNLLLKNPQLGDPQKLKSQLQAQIENLPPGRATLYAQVNYARSLMRSSDSDVPAPIAQGCTPFPNNSSAPQSVATLLATAVQQARSLGDRRAETYALGTLGCLYQKNGQLAEAQTLTQQALLIAQRIQAADIAYQWQWQLGQLLRQQGKVKDAIAAYTQAFKLLESLRRDLVAMNPDVQFSFRDEVEPVYRQLVELLLLPDTNAETSQNDLRQARLVIESLQLAELDNFFREACLDARQPIDQVLDQQDTTAAAIYPIILSDRLEIILKLPQQPQLRHYTTMVNQIEVEQTLDQLREKLTIPSEEYQSQALAQKVYEWLIRPVETELAQNQIKTLVFVLDGHLRNVPMAALYDGNQYLVEKYSIALTPGLQLVEPSPIRQKQLRAIVAGVSEERPALNASSLPNVTQELETIQSLLPSQVLLNQNFTAEALQDRVSRLPFPVVHLATHGQFSSDASQTYIVAWDKRIYVNELDNLLRARDEKEPEPLEMLVLSACQTAEGDRRAALGLAGVAVRAGARSTLASLWNLADESAPRLMGHFYEILTTQQVTKAEALRQAQIKLLKDKYPSPAWAPYVLVGNWL